MSARPLEAGQASAESAVDERNPWLGLASFTEETRDFFYGRDEEVAELARRVQRKLLTVLFGQSGLGKTSILRAGLVPRLREQGYCPVYVRLDYGRDSPQPAEQIKEAIARSARRSGQWTQAGVAEQGESLWEFLHHRDDVLRDEAGRTLIPLLIFDQFEEIFTLAQSDDFGRRRAATFIEELADLVENRPPKALEARFEADESGAEKFDFARSDYRVLIALREDYLAPLEGLKKIMPSISQNRLRLARMNGQQALSAVLLPGKRLVNEEVAAAIVRFVAGGAELSHAEVEPSLLSLICRELNDARIGEGRSEISLDLLAGSHAGILSNFYERALADQPAAVREIIEDDLLTSSGFRENVAEERLESRFTAAGAAPGTLSTLVNRRLLRIEERLDVRRVELTHDVLCGVVMGSRDKRREREAREATEQLLKAQHAREMAARAALKRARVIAAGCTLLAVFALIAAVLAYFSTERARRAELEAQQTRSISEKARRGAERLLGYLSDDFVQQLESFGRLDIVAEFSRRQIDYFQSLPAVLKNAETTRIGALAMVHYARAMRSLGKLDQSRATDAEAVALLEGLRSRGDASEATTIALALGYAVQGQIFDSRNDPLGPKISLRALELMKPLAERPGASLAARQAYLECLIRVGFEQQAGQKNADAIATETLAMRIAAELGGRDLSNLEMGALYAEAGAWLVSALANRGDTEQARVKGLEALAVAEQVLDRRPGYHLALHAAQVIDAALQGAELDALNPAAALKFAEQSIPTSAALLKFDPSNIVSLNNAGVAEQSTGEVLWAMGRLTDAVPHFLKGIDYYGRASAGGTTFILNHAYNVARTSYHQAEMGDLAAARATIQLGADKLKLLRDTEPKENFELHFGEMSRRWSQGGIALLQGDYSTARNLALESIHELESLQPHSDQQHFQKYISSYATGSLAGRAQYLLGDYAGAEKSVRAAIQARKEASPIIAISDQRDIAELSTWLTLALVGQGRNAEAAREIGPVVTLHRSLAAKNQGDQWQHVELALAIYAQALTERAHRAELLREAAAGFDKLPDSVRSLKENRLWRERIGAAERDGG